MGIADAVRQRLYALMATKGLTINGLSMLAGVTQSTANDFLKGTSSNIGIITLKKLIDGLDITITEFFDAEIFQKLNQEMQ